MADQLRNWLKENHNLALFLIGQLIAVLSAGGWLIAHYVTMESRISVMEARGATYTVNKLEKLEHSLTVLEQKVEKNNKSIERIIEVLTRELRK